MGEGQQVNENAETIRIDNFSHIFFHQNQFANVLAETVPLRKIRALEKLKINLSEIKRCNCKIFFCFPVEMVHQNAQKIFSKTLLFINRSNIRARKKNFELFFESIFFYQHFTSPIRTLLKK